MKMLGLLQDVRYSVRTLRRTPFFMAAAIVMLAIGVGATTAMVTLLDAVLVRPLPYPDADRVVRITGLANRLPLRATESGFELTSVVDFPELASSPFFAAVGSYVTGGVKPDDLRPDAERFAMRLAATSDYFSALGIDIVAGRPFTSADHLDSPPS